MLRPSGDQLGNSTAASPPLAGIANSLLMSCVTLEPSPFIMKMPPSGPPTALKNAIFVPSGDHDGQRPRPSTRSLDPSALMTRISGGPKKAPRLHQTKAILLPSADQVGIAPCVSRVTPEPSSFAT